MYPKEYIEYLIHFHAHRDYFECHEILEEFWKSVPTPKRQKVWVGLIQIAVSLYHHRRHNYQGALKMLQSALAILQAEKKAVTKLGLDYAALLERLEQQQNRLQAKKAYTSINLPISDPQLLQQCQKICQEEQLHWSKPSNLKDIELIDRHTRRDRSDVIEERLAQKQLREKSRQKKTR